MARIRGSRRLIVAGAIAGALVAGCLSVAVTGVGTSPSNRIVTSDQATVSGVALRLIPIKGESKSAGHEDTIDILPIES